MTLSHLIHAAHQLGYLRSARIAADMAALRVLQHYYGFHAWHASAPMSARPYRRIVAQLANENADPSRCVVEVGCGLGSIISRVDGLKRVGYDPDNGAIRAARLLRRRAVTFVHGTLESVAEHRIDLLILVNWIHSISPAQLDAWLTPLLPRIRQLLVDAIDPEVDGYPFRHDFGFLHGRATEVKSVRAPDEPRRFVLYDVADESAGRCQGRA